MAEGGKPVVFVHGLWLHASSWGNWAELFAENGYEPTSARLARRLRHGRRDTGEPGQGCRRGDRRRCRSLRPGDRRAGDEAARGRTLVRRAHRPATPRPGARLGCGCDRPGSDQGRPRTPAVGPQGRVDRPPQPVEQAKGRLAHARAVPLRLRERRHRAGVERALRPLGDPLAWASRSSRARSPRSRRTHPRRSTRGTRRAARFSSLPAARDHTVPPAISRSTVKLYRHSTAITDHREFPDRGHSLTIDSGWREVADAVLHWLKERGL